MRNRVKWVPLLFVGVVAGPLEGGRQALAMPSGGDRDRPLLPVRWDKSSPKRTVQTTRIAEQTEASSVPGSFEPAKAGGTCRTDDQCGAGTFCDQERGRCARIRRHVNVLYLFYLSRDRTFTEILGLYWHQKGKKGYQVAFPLYWSVWSPKRRGRVLFPFYFDFSRGRGHRQVIVPPVQVVRDGGDRRVRVWPLVFYSGYANGGRSLTVLPFVHHSRGPSHSTTVLPLVLSYARRDAGGDSQGLIGGLFFWRNQGQRRTRALLPLVWHRRSSPEQSFTWVAPLNFYSRNRGERTLIAAPLLFHHSEPGESTTFNLAPLLYHHKSFGRRRLYLPPLLGYHRNEAGRMLTLGPAYAYGFGESKGFGVAPLLFSGWSPRRRHLMLLPLFLYRSQGGGLRRQLISPLLVHERDAAEQRSQWALLAPPYYRLRDKRREIDLLPPLFARWHDKLTLSTTWVSGPLLLRRTPKSSAQMLVPLFWRFWRPGHSTWLVGPSYFAWTPESNAQVVFPLFWRFWRPERSTLVAGPFYHHRDRQDADHPRTWAGLIPLAFYHRTPHTFRLTLLPLGYHRHDAGEDGLSLTVLGPGYYSRRGSVWHTGVAPLFFAGRTEQRRYLSLMPAWWHHRSKSSSFTWAAPLNFYHHDRVRRRRHLLSVPLFWHQQRPTGFTTVSLAPPMVLHRSEHRTGLYMPLPFLYHRAGTRRTFGLGPFYYHGREDGRYLGLAPLLFTGWAAQRRHLVVFPLFWRFRTPERSTWVTGPFYYHRDRDRLWAGLAPVAFYKKTPDASRLTVLPLFHHRSSDKGQRRLFLSPLFIYERDRASERTQWALVAPPIYRRRDRRREIDLVLPFYARVQDKQEGKLTRAYGPLVLHDSKEMSRQVVYPLFWRSKSHKDGSGTTLLFPLVYRRREADGRTFSLVGPTYWRTDDRGWSAGLLPLVYFGRRTDRNHAVLFPIFWHFGRPKEGRSFTLAGLYTRSRTPTAEAHSLWPLIHYHRRTSPEGRHLFASVLPIFYYESNPSSSRLVTPVGGYSRRKGRTWGVVGPFYAKSSARSRSVGVVPLFFGTWKRGDFRSRHRFALVPALYYSHKRSRTTFCTPAFGFTKTSRSSLWYAGTYMAYRSQHTRLDLALPLGFVHQNRHRRRTTVFALPGYFGRWSPERSAHVLAPLVWSFRRPTGSSTVIFPALWDFHHRGVARSTVIFPLYWRHRDEQRQRTSHLLPLLWVRNRQAQGQRVTDAVVFPLFWRFGGPHRRSTVAFPLYWSFRKQDRRATVLFPLYWDFTRGQQRVMVALNTLYVRYKRPGTYDFHFLPILRVQRKRPEDFKISFIAGLFGYERIGRNRFLKLLLIPIRLKPSARAPRRVGMGMQRGRGISL